MKRTFLVVGASVLVGIAACGGQSAPFEVDSGPSPGPTVVTPSPLPEAATPDASRPDTSVPVCAGRCAPPFVLDSTCTCVCGLDAAQCPDGTVLGPNCSCEPLDANVQPCPTACLPYTTRGPSCTCVACPVCQSGFILASDCTCLAAPEGGSQPDATTLDGSPPPDRFEPPLDVSPPQPDGCSLFCPPYTLPDFGGCSCVACAACPAPFQLLSDCSCSLSEEGGFDGFAPCQKCPQGLTAGPNCSCVPADAGPAPDARGVGPGCWLGFQFCESNTWCELGVCTDGATQYGCYCDANGVATCSLACPPPAPCFIANYGDCPVNQTCVVGSCPDGGGAVTCSCSLGGFYSCNSSCNGEEASLPDGAPIVPDASPGPGCWIAGSDFCPAGTFCSLGTCEDNVTPFGCFCNTDGTANCTLQCPPPAPCFIPGFGACPVFSSCDVGTSPQGCPISCFCSMGGSFECSSQCFEGGI